MTPEDSARVWRSTFQRMATWEREHPDAAGRGAFDQAWADAIAEVQPSPPPSGREKADCWQRWLHAGQAPISSDRQRTLDRLVGSARDAGAFGGREPGCEG